jgi:hypothetical protein
VVADPRHLLTDPPSTYGWIRGVLESMYSGLAALDTSDYRWSSEERWTQARYLGETGGSTAHLEALVELGDATYPERSRVDFDSTLVVSIRLRPDDTSESQARLHAAAAAAAAWLEGWHYADATARALVRGYRVESVSSEWCRLRVSFTLLRLRR